MTNATLADVAARGAQTMHRKRLERIENAHDLVRLGESPDAAAAHLGVSGDRLREYLSYPVPDLAGEEPADDLPPSPVPALEPERRIARAKPAAADVARCVAASDAEGVRILLHRVRDWYAVAIVLAECCDPGRTAVVTGRQERQREERAA